MGILYVVATPIGNLSDITLRALEILKSANLILAEDKRVAIKLLDHYDIKKDILIYNQHTFKNKNKLNRILSLLQEGKDVALVSDAGTPGVSDPGNELINYIYNIFGSEQSISVIPIPGPSALTATLSVCGFKIPKFIFLGFFPKKKKLKLTRQLEISDLSFVYFDSPHRVVKNLEFLKEQLGDREIFVARELTKLHETHYRGTISRVLEELAAQPLKGEFVIIVRGNN